MICCLLACASDIRQAQSLLQWIAQLGKVDAPLLLVCDKDTPFDRVIDCQKVALECFSDCHITTNEVAVKGWPGGALSLFKAAAKSAYERFKSPFLVLESDAIPIRAGWFDLIRKNHHDSGAPYLGHLYEGTENFTGEKFLSGIAVYPADTFTRLKWADQPVAWDVHYRNEITKHAAHTDLIVHFWGQADGGVRFIADGREPQSPREKHLSWIPERAVIYHRDKRQSLLPLLRKKLFNESGKLIKIVIPVHAGDIAQAIRHAQWLKMLHKTKNPHTAVVSFDLATPIHEVAMLTNLLRDCFESVEQYSYIRPPIPGYPASANWMFQSTAIHMSRQAHPWFLLEADAVVLRADWLERLQDAYDSCGQPFFGPFVKGMNHLNGSMIYPPDAPYLLPTAMRCVTDAWDYLSGPEMKPNASDASDLMQHGWSVIGDELSEVGGGNIPTGFTPEKCRKWLRRSSVVYHRVKDSSLVDALISGAYRHD